MEHVCCIIFPLADNGVRVPGSCQVVFIIEAVEQFSLSHFFSRADKQQEEEEGTHTKPTKTAFSKPKEQHSDQQAATSKPMKRARDAEEEEAEKEELQTIATAADVRRAAAALERRVAANIDARSKHAGSPARFMESELALDEELRALRRALSAAQGRLLPAAVAAGVPRALLALLAHENDDVACDAAALLSDCAEPDDDEDADDAAGAGAWVDALLDARGVELFAAHAARIAAGAAEDAEAAEALQAALGFFEHAMEARPAEARAKMAACEQLVRFLLERTVAGGGRGGVVDDVAAYACELLAILLHGSDTPEQRRVGELGGVDALLRTLSGFKRRKPANGEEEEFLENAFDSLCSLLLVRDNQRRFDESEGTDLMLIIAKENAFAQKAVARTLDFQLQNNPAGCVAFVEALGLKTLFALLMKGARRKTYDKDFDEHVVSCILSLWRFLEGERRARLVAKFVESGCEKTARMLDIHEHYSRVVDALPEAASAGTEEDEQRFLDRLDAGLFLLQSASLVLVHAATADSTVAAFLAQQHNSSKIHRAISDRAKEFATQLGTEGERLAVVALVEAFDKVDSR